MTEMTDKQIYQISTPKPNPELTDIVPQSDESSNHKTVRSTWNQILSSIVNLNAQLASISQVTGLNSGIWDPAYTLADGILSATTFKGYFLKLGAIVIGILNFNVELEVDLVNLGVSLPIAPNFTANNQAMGGNLSFISAAEPALVDGQINRVISNNVAQRIEVEINAAVGSGNKIICMFVVYQIQN